MPINEYKFYNGVVLNGLIEYGKPIKIEEFPTSSKNSFMLNGNKRDGYYTVICKDIYLN